MHLNGILIRMTDPLEMRAARLFETGTPPEVVTVPVPEPGPGEVRVAVHACGICGSDVHILSGDIPTATLPLTLGHEAAGIVDKVGPGVDVPTGQRVLINPIVVCGSCHACRAGHTNQCPDNIVLGVGAAGAAADYVIAPATNVHAIPDTIDFATAAIMADAIAGPFHAIRNSGVAAGDSVAVYGLGGLGLHAVMILKQVFGAHVIGIDAADAALDRAADFGVTQVIDARTTNPSKAVREATSGGVGWSFEFVGAAATVEQAIRSLRPGGQATIVGVSTDKFSNSFTVGTLVSREWSVRGSYGYVADDLDDLIALVSDGTLTIDGTITHRFPLARFDDALTALRNRHDDPIRIVVENQPLARR